MTDTVQEATDSSRCKSTQNHTKLWDKATNRNCFVPAQHVFLPLDHKGVRQIADEIEDRGTGSSKVGAIEEDAYHETLSDGGHGETDHEEKDRSRIGVFQDAATLDNTS